VHRGISSARGTRCGRQSPTHGGSAPRLSRRSREFLRRPTRLCHGSPTQPSSLPAR
jgi:hypothetical protein